MTDFETEIWKAISQADRAFEKAGASGTKTWMRDYFLPALQENGLEIRRLPVDPMPPV